MTTIKAYTDISQSKKLAEILPLESADMNWHELPPIGLFVRAFPYKHDNGATEGIFPCWSLASLLGILPKNLNIGRPSLESNYKGYYWIQYYDEFMKPNDYKTECFNNPVDACVAMIEKLNELNLL